MRTHSVLTSVSLDNLVGFRLAFQRKWGKAADQYQMWPTCARPECWAFDRHGIIRRPDVDHVDLVERGPTHVVVLGKHHGKEDALKVDFGLTYTQEDLNFAWRNLVFFESELRR